MKNEGLPLEFTSVLWLFYLENFISGHLRMKAQKTYGYFSILQLKRSWPEGISILKRSAWSATWFALRVFFRAQVSCVTNLACRLQNVPHLACRLCQSHALHSAVHVFRKSLCLCWFLTAFIFFCLHYRYQRRPDAQHARTRRYVFTSLLLLKWITRCLRYDRKT